MQLCCLVKGRCFVSSGHSLHAPIKTSASVLPQHTKARENQRDCRASGCPGAALHSKPGSSISPPNPLSEPSAHTWRNIRRTAV
uniref:Uncharacterized protein n=1 Tax=Pygocentrus nattereri TaxID=42514 RepID=A0A3B4C4F6_PYGNA